MSSSLRLEKVTSDNVGAACLLKVRPDQDGLVKPVAWSLAQAYAAPEVAWPRLIFDGERLVGFVMAFFDIRFDPDKPDDRPRSGLWRLNTAADQQGRRYGRFAVEAVCEEIQRRRQMRTTVTWVPGAHGPELPTTGRCWCTSRDGFTARRVHLQVVDHAPVDHVRL